MIYPYQHPVTSKAWHAGAAGAPGSCFESRKPKTLEVPEATTSHGFTWHKWQSVAWETAKLATCHDRERLFCHSSRSCCVHGCFIEKRSSCFKSFGANCTGAIAGAPRHLNTGAVQWPSRIQRLQLCWSSDVVTNNILPLCFQTTFWSDQEKAKSGHPKPRNLLLKKARAQNEVLIEDIEVTKHCF